ncbi:MAG: hypothetical protein A3E85_04235 [Gammaproteobacteria bacterium RIFCSPHIGHO2_12_FULL_45_12]|nr:MAG: hypothetical protein A3E85_04235 [Gammaproteobacteria bacterium RIFCSPHIGHO2_12_FULL_45_12]
MQRILSKLLPFVFAGIAVVAFIFGIMLLVYLFIFGAIVGFILFAVVKIREKLFPRKKNIKSRQQSGVTIDADHWTEL